jgi:hypothetical protein
VRFYLFFICSLDSWVRFFSYECYFSDTLGLVYAGFYTTDFYIGFLGFYIVFYGGFEVGCYEGFELGFYAGFLGFFYDTF